ncbi:MAG: hypothetical protein E7168_04935 [Firmicutes bacterium]|nr:hypothetical protein [Bacillota bacterium]
MEFIIILVIVIFLFYKNGKIKGMIEELKYPFSNDPEKRYKTLWHHGRARRKARNVISYFIGLLSFSVIIISYGIYDYFDDTIEKNKELAKEIEGDYYCIDNKGNKDRLTLDTVCFFHSNINEQCEWEVDDGIVKISYYERK